MISEKNKATVAEMMTAARVIWYGINAVLIDKKESGDIADMFILEPAEKPGDRVTFREMGETKSMIRGYLNGKMTR